MASSSLTDLALEALATHIDSTQQYDFLSESERYIDRLVEEQQLPSKFAPKLKELMRPKSEARWYNSDSYWFHRFHYADNILCWYEDLVSWLWPSGSD